MIRRLLCAALTGALAVPSIAAKPPDLPDNPTITFTPQAAPLPAPALYQLRPTARRTLVGSLLFGIHPMLALLPTDKILDAPCDHPPPGTASPLVEALPMPREESDVTCPYLRQQMLDRHACQLADPEIGRDVLDNLKLLKEADNLLEMAKELADNGYLIEAMECCDRASELCPGSPCAQRAADTMMELALGIIKPEADTEEAKEKAIGKKLKRPVSMCFTNVPLRQVLDDLRASQGINIYVDEPALNEKGIALDSPVTIQLDNIALKSSLKLLLNLVHLTYVVSDGVLKITTENYAHGKLERRVYSIADLLEHELPKDFSIPSRQGESPANRLINVISNTILPLSWSERGGFATIDYFPKTQSLVINQTPDAQDQIIDLLSALRRLYDKEDQEKEKPCLTEKADGSKEEPGTEEMVCGLMKACHLLMSQGMQHQAAELARQAYALDPERVMADPLIYKMHLLAESPPVGASEASEPPTCPYCPSAGKPIRAIVPEKKKRAAKPTTRLVPPLPPIDYEVVPALESELTEANGDLRLSGDCSLGSNVYHLRYRHGSLAIWKTPDAGKSKP